MKKNKKVTLEDLAGMVANGFESVDKRFDEIEIKIATKEELSKLEQKVSKIDFRLDEVYDILQRFEENDILNLQKRVQILEKAVRTIAKQMS